MGIISYLSTGYQSSFNSPYSLETCKEILLNFSQLAYSEPSPKWSIFESNNNKLESGNRIIDVYPETPNRYTFRIEYFSMEKSRREKEPYAVKGVLEGEDNNPTQVTCECVYDKKETSGVFFGGIVFIFILIIVGWVSISSNSKSGQVMGVFYVLIIPLIGSGICYTYIYKNRQVIAELKKWLDGQSDIPISDHLHKIKHNKGYQFDFYVQDELTECIHHLTKLSQGEHYQYTSVGMVKGMSLADDYFITMQQIPPSQCRFLITDDTYATHPQIRTEIVGELIREDNITLVHGCTTIKTSFDFTFTVIFICVLGGLAIALELGLIISILILILVVSAVSIGLWLRLQQSKSYIRDKLLMTPVFDLVTTSNDVHFHSPYPIDDCVNMLMGYSPEFSEYPTPWGLGRKITRDNMRIILYEQDPSTHYFWIYSGTTVIKPRISRVTIKGKLEVEGYGTKIDYAIENWMNQYFHLAFLGILLITLLSVFISPVITTLLGFCIIAFSAIYIVTWREMKTVREYAQFLLSGKANRKQKVADTPKSE